MKKYALIVIVLFNLLFANMQLVHIDRFYSKSRSNDVAICAHFTHYFDEYSAKKLKPFITITPKKDFSLRVDYKEICIGNLEPSKEYTIFISQKIPLGKEQKLNQDYKRVVKTADYAPSSSFKESGYILPLKGDISIPIETMNIDKLSVSLYRINSNNLIDAINRYGFVRALEYYDLDEIENEKGYKLWEKIVVLHNQKNIKKTWAIDVGKYIKKRESGVYILAVTTLDKDGKPRYYTTKTQWFMISDIGLFSLEDDSGLYIYTKHLSDASSYDNLTLKLIAKNNEVLATQKPIKGVAKFDKALLEGEGGLKAQAVYAYGDNGDFSVLDLSHPPLDLSDRGVNGRTLPKDYDAFIYSNRAIFRPGEKIPVHMLIKTPSQKVAAHITISAKLIDSSEQEIDKKLINTDDLGFASTTFALSKRAKTGRYKIALFATNQKEPIGVWKFLVEDFVPPKIEIKVLKKPAFVLPKQKATITASVRYLTQEPLKSADIEVQRVIHRAKAPFPAYKRYHFGRLDERFGNVYLETRDTKSDNNGTFQVDITSNEYFKSSLPLAMFVSLRAFEPGGRAIEHSLDLFYAHNSAYIGIKAEFEDDYIDLNAKPSFKIIYLKNQKASAKELSYRLIEEESEYSWSYNGESWEYEVDYSDVRVVQKGTIKTKAAPTLLTLPKLSWGTYRLEVYENKEIISSYRFYSGYWGGGSKHTPDRLPISINKQSFAPNEKLLVHIKPKFSGPVVVAVANHHIFKRVTIDAKEGQESQIAFKVDKNWGSSVYILATAFRAQNKVMGASRAIGVAHFFIKDPKRVLDLSLKLPKRVHSKSNLTVFIESQKAKKQKVFFTLSAVDKGVLNLTHYQMPNPIEYFFGKLRLGITLRDIYGELIKAQGEHAPYDVGAGDDFDSSELKDKPTTNQEKVVAFMSKKIELQNGKAKVTIPIAEYQGALKVQAIAWSKNALGEAHSEVVVKDPISLELFMPRFLAIGDKAQLTLKVTFDKALAKKSYKLLIESKGAELFSNSFDINNSLPTLIKKFQIRALQTNEATITLKVLDNNTTVASRSYSLAIKYPLPKSYVRQFNILKSHESLDPKKLIQEANITTLLKAHLVVSNQALIPTSSIKQELLDYAYRCAEQTTSRAFVLLDSNNSFEKNEIQTAIERLLSLQKFNGSFGLWGNSQSDLWVSAYVMDFLTRAYKKGYKIPKKALQSGLHYLENSINRWVDSKEEQEANIYALYVLTRNNIILLSDIMHFVTTMQSKVSSAMAWGELGVALELVGKKELASEIFSKAKLSFNSSYPYAHYGGALRDKAALVVLLAEAKRFQEAQSLLIDLSYNLQKERYLSTQEMSQILRASQAVHLNFSKIALKVGNRVYQANKPYTLKVSDIHSLEQITNIGKSDLWWSLSYIALPSTQSFEHFKNKGFRIEKHIYTLNGSLVDSKALEQGERFVVVLNGEITDSAIKDILLTDFLPAGFEIENPNIQGIDNTLGLSWLRDLTVALHTEYRDDRFSAFFYPKKRKFKFAYIIRAVTLGSFALAPAKIEDMYQARYRAFSNYPIKELQIIKDSTLKEKQENNITQNALSSQEYIQAATTPLKSLKHYSLYQIYYLRNAIFAYVGLDFSQTNPALFDRFKAFNWYKPRLKSGALAYSKLNSIQKSNVEKLLEEEKKRLDGLVLADFYRVNTKELDKKLLEKYSKKELRILRNSLLARYGYSFQDAHLRELFTQFPWYHTNSQISAQEIIEKKMNTIQKNNFLKLVAFENTKQ